MRTVPRTALPRRDRESAGFTLVELLVATTVLLIIVGFGISILGQVSNVWRSSSAKIEAFQSARVGFDLVTRHVGQMTLNTYLDYVDDNNHFLGDKDTAGISLYTDKPARYARQSDLHFVCAPCAGALSDGSKMPGTANTGTAVFFQMTEGFVNPPDPNNASAPANPNVGLNSALNACGYYVEFGSDSDLLPPHVANGARYRYRLKQLLVPTEKNSVYVATSLSTALPISYKWFTDFTTPADPAAQKYFYPVANNIIALVVRPQDPSDATLFQTSYVYDSRVGTTTKPQPVTANQLPPVMRVTMIAIDETSALRMQSGTQEPAVIKGILAGKFQDPAKMDADLNDATTGVIPALNKAKIGYRLFSSSVAIKGSKWTK